MTPQQQSSTSKRSAKDFIFGKEIGEGSFSTVYLAKDVNTHKEYAIKVCEKKHIIREKKVEYVKREKEVLALLSDCASYFVRLYCTFQDNSRLYFVLTYAKNGELLKYLNKVGSFDLPCTKYYTAELILALEILKNKGIVHRDLKPENILLDERMHVLITDFGSAKLLSGNARQILGSSNKEDENKKNKDEGDSNNSEDESRRRNSFVGTAQYVSPELLTDSAASHASDLWALGCIVYQMVSGHPPFQSASEYLIFQKIINLQYTFPEGFDEDVKDFVQKLLVLDPKSRLGALDEDDYTSLRLHKIYEEFDWDNLGSPPKMSPYLPDGDSSQLRTQYKSQEPGLDDRKISQLQIDTIVATPSKKGIADLTTVEIKQRLETQKKEIWHQYVEGNLILKQGLVDKRKGIRARRRMFLLTLGPHLYYVDPGPMVLKGQIPWTADLRVEAKNFKVFWVHTPNRIYYLEDPDGYALEWCKAIEEVHNFSFPH